MASDVMVMLRASITDLQAKLGTAKKEMDGLASHGASLGDKMQALGKGAALGLGAAVTAVGVYSVHAAINFQSSMELIRTQAGASQGEVDKMSKAVLGLAGPTATAPEELATALYHIESTGVRGKTALDELKTAAEGAKVGHANLEDVTNALNATVASGIPGVSNMSQAMGALNSIVGAGDMKMQDLADAMGTGVLAVVKGFGVNLTDAGAALATFGDNNIRGADAASMLRQTVMAFAHPVKTAGAALQDLGLTQSSLADDMQKHGFGYALQDLSGRLDVAKSKGQDVGALLVDAFGKKAGPGVAVLTDQFTRFQSKQEEVRQGAGHFGDAWQATTKTTGFQVQQLQASGEALATSLGQKLIPIVSDVVSWLNKNHDAVYALAIIIGGLLTAAAVNFAVGTVAQFVRGIGSMVTGLLGLGGTATTTAGEVAAAGTAAEVSGGEFTAGGAEAEAGGGMFAAAAGVIGKSLGVLAVGVAAYEGAMALLQHTPVGRGLSGQSTNNPVYNTAIGMGMATNLTPADVAALQKGARAGDTQDQVALKAMGYSYATGGIALTPQLAAIAENGPEAIIPLSDLGGGSGGSPIVFELHMDGTTIARATMPYTLQALYQRKRAVGTLQLA